MFNNKFIIVFEGIDGSGKTTQCEMLCDYLNNQKIRNRYEKFPDNSLDKRLFDKIRDICTNDELYYKFIKAARAYETSKTSFLNLLEDSNYEIVVYDRYKYTDNVNLKIDGVKQQHINLLSNWLPDPDLLFYIDIDVSIAMKRILSRGRKIHWHENENFLLCLSGYFKEEFENVNTDLCKLDANKSIVSLHTEVCNALINSMSNINRTLFIS